MSRLIIGIYESLRGKSAFGKRDGCEPLNGREAETLNFDRRRYGDTTQSQDTEPGHGARTRSQDTEPGHGARTRSQDTEHGAVS